MLGRFRLCALDRARAHPCRWAGWRPEKFPTEMQLVQLAERLKSERDCGISAGGMSEPLAVAFAPRNGTGMLDSSFHFEKVYACFARPHPDDRAGPRNEGEMKERMNQ